MAAVGLAIEGAAKERTVAAIERGLSDVRRVTQDGRVGYAAGYRGTFSAGRNAGVLLLMVYLGLADDDLVAPIRAIPATKIDKLGTGHGSPVRHLSYVGLAPAHLAPKAHVRFDTLDRDMCFGGRRRTARSPLPRRPVAPQLRPESLPTPGVRAVAVMSLRFHGQNFHLLDVCTLVAH